MTLSHNKEFYVLSLKQHGILTFSYHFHVRWEVLSVGPLHMNCTNPAFTVPMTGYQFTNTLRYFTNSLSINK
jgi:hypothetical protein